VRELIWEHFVKISEDKETILNMLKKTVIVIMQRGLPEGLYAVLKREIIN
jgi:hypothetical protein